MKSQGKDNSWISKLEKEGIKKKSSTVKEESIELFPDLIWIWEGFLCLSGSRSYNDDNAQSISITDISSFCNLSSIVSSDQKQLFLTCVVELDNVWLEDYIVKLNKFREKPRTKASKRGKA